MMATFAPLSLFVLRHVVNREDARHQSGKSVEGW
jgi:hypothetical protein